MKTASLVRAIITLYENYEISDWEGCFETIKFDIFIEHVEGVSPRTVKTLKRQSIAERRLKLRGCACGADFPLHRLWTPNSFFTRLALSVGIGSVELTFRCLLLVFWLNGLCGVFCFSTMFFRTTYQLGFLSSPGKQPLTTPSKLVAFGRHRNV